MTAILSRTAPVFDISAAGLTAGARDLGEVIALLAGGVRPDPEVLSRLSVSLRSLQGFLLAEAGEQAAREEVRALIGWPPSDRLSPYASQPRAAEERAEHRRARVPA